MRLRVIHKGLLIISVPLLIELILIGALTVLLALADHEQRAADAHRQLTFTVIRLMFADFGVGVSMIDAWVSYSQPKAEDLQARIVEVEQLSSQLRQLPPPPNEETRQLLDSCLSGQNRLESHFRRLAATFIYGTVSLEQFRHVVRIHSEMVKDIDELFTTLIRFRDVVQNIVADSRKLLRKLNQMQLLIVVVGAAANLLAAGWCLRFLRKGIVERLGIIEENTRLLATGLSPSPPLSGSDEIFELDRAFHAMHQELLSAESRERSLFNNSTEVLAILDKDLCFVQQNRSAEPILGRPPEKLTGMSLQELIGDAYEPIRQILLMGMHEGRPVNFEAQANRPDETLVPLSWSATWSHEKDLLYAIARDISQEKRAEQFKAAYLQLIRRDFRLPLTRLAQLFTDLSQSNLCPEAEEKVSTTQQTIQRLIALVDELLAVDEIQGHKFELHCQTHSVADTVAQSIRDVEALAAEKQIELVVDCPANLRWYADKAYMARVLVNLLSNAIKFSPVRSTVHMSLEVDQDGKVHARVHDQGRGVPQPAVARLFQPFKQARAEDSERGKGTGLGLYICKQIIKAHGGEIGVESEENVGSTFWFTIPAAGHRSSPEQGSASRSRDTTVSDANSHLKAAGESKTVKASWLDKITVKRKMQGLVGVVLAFQLLFIAAMLFLLHRVGSELSESQAQLDAVQMSVVDQATDITFGLYTLILNEVSPYRTDSSRPSDRTGPLAQFDKYIRRFKKADLPRDVADYRPRILSLVGEARRLVQKLGSSPKSRILRQREQLPLMKTAVALSQAVEELSANYNQARSAPDFWRSTRRMQAILLIIGIIFSIGSAVALMFLFSHGISRRLFRLEANAARFAARLALEPPTPGEDEIARLDLAFHEMTDRLIRARARESAFLENSQDLIFSLDEQANIQAANRALERLGQAQSYLGTPFTDLLPPDQQPPFREMLSIAKKSHGPLQTETVLATQNHRLDLLLALSWKESDKAYFCLAHDISARRELERIRKEFISMVTHDLRTPLAGLLMLSDVMSLGTYGDMPAEASEKLNRIRMECSRILDLVNDFLDLEKLTSGQMALKLDLVDLREVLEMALSQIQPSALSEKIHVQFQIVDCSMPADAERLAQGLAGLLTTLARSSDKLEVNLKSSKSHVTTMISCSGVTAGSRIVQRLSLGGLFQSMADLDPEENRLRLPLALRILESHGAALTPTMSQAGNLSLSISFTRSSNRH